MRVGQHDRSCCPGEAGRCGADGQAAEGRHHVDVVGQQVAQDQREHAVPGQSGSHPMYCGRVPESGFPEVEHAGLGDEVCSLEPAELCQHNVARVVMCRPNGTQIMGVPDPTNHGH